MPRHLDRWVRLNTGGSQQALNTAQQDGRAQKTSTKESSVRLVPVLLNKKLGKPFASYLNQGRDLWLGVLCLMTDPDFFPRLFLEEFPSRLISVGLARPPSSDFAPLYLLAQGLRRVGSVRHSP